MAGGGPAGAAAALVLAAGGASVVVLERSEYDGVRVGETLPPDVRPLLEGLGVWDRFVDGGHLPAPGIVAAWGSPEPYANDFIVNPYGCGWRVDRNRFDAMLVGAATEAGATVLTSATVLGCRRAGAGGWELSVAGGEGPVTAAVVVDATGRGSPLGRWVGARSEVRDRLVALVAYANGRDPARIGPDHDHQRTKRVDDHRALIEATPDGWWYSGLLPDGRLVLAFQTDAGPGLASGWDRFLAAAPLTAARAAGRIAGPPRVVPASTRRAVPAAGAGWLAAGDAAAAYDPICGLGILWALDSGMAAAEAVLAGDLEAYAHARRGHFDRYLDTRTRWYRVEDRWPDAPFWARRHR